MSSGTTVTDKDGQVGRLMAKKKAKTSVSRFDAKLDLAEPVSARVQLKHVILAETIARRKPSLEGIPSTVSLNVNVTTKTNKRKRLIQVLPRFTLIATNREGGGDELIRIEALFVIQYEVDSFKGLEKSNVGAFGELNGLYNVWPYWREYVQATTVRMGLPALTIPVFRPLAARQRADRGRGAAKRSRKRQSTARARIN
jgi:hypothetical protein